APQPEGTAYQMREQTGPQIAYTVTATLPGAALAEEYIAWLTGGHVADVIAGGAVRGQIARLDPGPEASGAVRIEVRYLFPDRAAFDRYEREGAPRLRAEGLARFGPDRGVTFERRVGEVVARV